MQTYNDHDFSLRVLKRILLEWITPSEGSPETPWDGEEAGPLAFGPGVVWANGGRRTIAMSFEPYELGVGDPGIYLFTRTLQFQVDTAGAPAVFVHNLHQYPIVQVLEHGTGPAYGVFDLDAAGGSILHTDNDTVTVDFGGAFIGLVLVFG